MKLVSKTLLVALAVIWGSASTAVGQNDDLGYGNAPGTMTRDLSFGPEWRAYQTISQPGGGELPRPQTMQPQPPMPTATPAPPSPAPMLKQTDYALRFFGGDAARQTLQQMPQRPQTTAHSSVLVGPRVQKPFQNASNGSTISPYLNLDRPETTEELPNYFTFVRPQFEQQNVNRRQQREMQKLERQVQAASYNAPANTRAGAPGTGHGTRFGDTGRYYSGWRR